MTTAAGDDTAKPKPKAKAKPKPKAKPKAKPKPPPKPAAPPKADPDHCIPCAPPPPPRLTAEEMLRQAEAKFGPNGTFGVVMTWRFQTIDEQLAEDLKRWEWHQSGRWPLSDWELWELRKDVGRLSRLKYGEGLSVSDRYSPGEMRIRDQEAEDVKRGMNTLTILATMPLSIVPATAQVMGANADAVSQLGVTSMDVILASESMHEGAIQMDNATQAVRQTSSHNEVAAIVEAAKAPPKVEGARVAPHQH